MKRFISFSGGVESTTMCILYGKGATAIWCDTGAEHKEMYDRIDFCEQQLKIIHNGDFELIRIKPSVNIKGVNYGSLVDVIVAKKFMPTIRQRFCTADFKIKPIDNFLKQQGECELMIGFNADEEPNKDRTGNYMKCKNVTYSYPLYEEGYDRNDCEEILTKYGMHPSFPIYMKRGGCFMCIFKSKSEYKAICVFDKDTFSKLKDFEQSYQDKRKRKFYIAQTFSMLSIEAEINEEIELWGIDKVKDMYKKVQPKQACGAFCHR